MKFLDSVPVQTVFVHQIEQLGMSQDVFQIFAKNDFGVLEAFNFYALVPASILGQSLAIKWIRSRLKKEVG